MVVLRPSGYFSGARKYHAEYTPCITTRCTTTHSEVQLVLSILLHVALDNICSVWPWWVTNTTSGWSSSSISRVIRSSINQSRVWWTSTQVLQHVPFLNSLSWLREHFVPVFCFDRRALAAEQELPDEFVDADEVMVHHGYKQTSATDVFEGNAKSETRIKNWAQRLLMHYRLLLFDFLSVS